MPCLEQMSATSFNGSNAPRTVVPAVAETKKGKEPCALAFSIFISKSDTNILPLDTDQTDDELHTNHVEVLTKFWGYCILGLLDLIDDFSLKRIPRHPPSFVQDEIIGDEC